VAAHFRVSETAAAKWVAKARKLGLLLPTTRGKARAVEPAKRTTARRKKR
jgi:transposase